MNTIKFKKGDRVWHIRGGTGEIKAIKKDTAVVKVLNTVFHDIRHIPIAGLQLDRRKK